jgi:hypothetical protein
LKCPFLPFFLLEIARFSPFFCRFFTIFYSKSPFLSENHSKTPILLLKPPFSYEKSLKISPNLPFSYEKSLKIAHFLWKHPFSYQKSQQKNTHFTN